VNCRLFALLLCACVLHWAPVSAAAGANQMTVIRSRTLNHPCAGLAWDRGREAVYLTDAGGKRLVKLRLVDGSDAGALGLARQPEAVVLSPNGARLYVAEVVRPHSDTWFDPQEGYLAVVDPETLTVIAEHLMDLDPFSLAATDDGLVAVAGGSGQWTRLITIDTRTGLVTGSESGVINMVNCLTLHPSQQWLYIGEPYSLYRLDLDPVQRYFRHLDNQPVSSPGGEWRAYIFPDGSKMLTANGYVFAVSVVRTNDFQPFGSIPMREMAAAAFNPENLSLFASDWGGRLRRFNSETLLPAGEYRLPAKPLELLATEAWLYSLTTSATQSVFTVYANPAYGAATNQAPVAAFSWTPAPATTVDWVRFDARPSTDDGPGGELTYEWDWNDDRVFDTAPTNAPLALRGFNVAGAYPVSLRVMDRHGAASTSRQVVEVALASDPGRTNLVHTPFELPFPAAHLVFDPVRPRLYATDSQSNRLVAVNLDTGRIERDYAFFHAADDLTVTPNGQWMYVGLLTRPHDMFYGGEQSGFVAEFDLETLVKTREFPLVVDPWALVATDTRKLVIISGAGQVQFSASYDAVTGQLRTLFLANTFQPVLLHPQGDRVFLFSRHSAGTYAFEYPVDPQTGVLGELRGYGNLTGYPPFVFSLDGSQLVSATGGVFDLVPGSTGDVPASHGLAKGTIWTGVFDAPERPAFIAGGTRALHLYNSHSFQWISSLPLAEEPLYVGRLGTRLFYASVVGNRTLIREVANPALGSEGNQPPTARLEVSPSAPLTRRPVVFDARTSSDDRDPLEVLQFRWDLDGDGAFDTPWTNTLAVTRSYIVPGDYRVAVEVRDSWGETNRAQQTVHATQEADPGEPGPEHTPWVLPFSAADATFDPVRPQLWLSDYDGKAVVRVSLASGRIEKRWSFPLAPESLAITPNGQRLYAAVLARPHDVYWFVQTGHIAEFDLASDTLLRVFTINLDPGDLAATDNGILLAAGGSGQNTYVQSHAVATGNMIGLASMYNGATLRLSPSQQKLFGATVWDANPYITRFTFDPASGALSAGPQSPLYIPERDGVGGRVFVLPGETQLLGGGGAIYTNQPGAANDLRVVKDLGLRPILDFALLPGRNEFVVAADRKIGYFRTGTLEPMHVLQLGRPAKFVGVQADAHFVVSVETNATYLSRRAYPATDPATNQPPRLRWLEPADGTAFPFPAAVHLAVEPEDLDGGIQRVEFRSATNALGTVTNYPFALDVYTLPTGNHVLAAVAYDNLGATNAPIELRLRVTQRPALQWLWPIEPAVLDAGSEAPLEVAASDPDGSVARVEFFRENLDLTNRLGVVTNAPWRFALTNFSATTTFYAQAVDNDGIWSNSPPVLVQLAGALGDDFYRPFTLTGLAASARASNRAATSQLFEQPVLAPAAWRTLWWTWTAPSNGIYEVTTRGSSFDTILGVYTGANISKLTTVRVNDDDPGAPPASTVKFAGQAGRDYRIAVDGFRDGAGDVILTLTLEELLPTAPANDNIATRAILSGTEATLAASNVAATSEGGEPSHAGILAGPSVWWEWTAPANGTVRLSTLDSEFDTVLAVYTGYTGAFSSLRSLVSNDDVTGEFTSCVVFYATRGVRYFIAVTGYGGTTGRFWLSLLQTPQPPGPPANDNFAGRIPVAGTSWLVEAANVGATVETREPRLSSDSSRATVWWSWRAPGWGRVYVRAVSGGFTARVAVFTGHVVTNLQQVASSTQSGKASALEFNALRDTEYAIAVDGAGGNTGSFILMLDAPALAGPPLLQLAANAAEGTLTLSYVGYPAATVVLLSSTNLLTWEPLLTNQLAPGAPLVFRPSLKPQEFYRLRVD
jgi:sugar lactone lactonase YvrE